MEQDDIIDGLRDAVEQRLDVDLDVLLIRYAPLSTLALKALVLAAVAGGMWAYLLAL